MISVEDGSTESSPFVSTIEVFVDFGNDLLIDPNIHFFKGIGDNWIYR